MALFGCFLFISVLGLAATPQKNSNQQNSPPLSRRFPNVSCSLLSTKYERLLMTKLRDEKTSTETFRASSRCICEALVMKVVECLGTRPCEIKTPVAPCMGEVLSKPIEFVTILRSGDALLETFMSHFPEAPISKILIQRNEQTAEPIFIYKKITPSISSGATVVILDPMVATGGSIKTAIALLKRQGVAEENILIACVVAAPEGLTELYNSYPKVRLVMNVLDEKLNERKYIVPGLGDFGDRYFGTCKLQ
jgi:uracil phosphoribosyltransferase